MSDDNNKEKLEKVAQYLDGDKEKLERIVEYIDKIERQEERDLERIAEYIEKKERQEERDEVGRKVRTIIMLFIVGGLLYSCGVFGDFESSSDIAAQIE